MNFLQGQNQLADNKTKSNHDASNRGVKKHVTE